MGKLVRKTLLVVASTQCFGAFFWSVAQYRLGDVKDDDGGLGTTVVHGGQTVVAFLSRSVPDLKLHCGLVQTHRLSQEGSWTIIKDDRGYQHRH